MYSEALEQQVSLLRYVKSDAGRNFLAYCNEVGLSQYGRTTMGWTDKTVRANLTEPLSHGEPFFWSPDTCMLLEHMAPSVPDCTLTREMLPTPAGYVWFSKPIIDSFTKFDILTGMIWHLLGEGQEWSVHVIPILRHSIRPAGLPVGAFRWRVGSRISELDHLGPELDRAFAKDMEGARLHFVRTFASMLLFLEQRMLVVSRQQAERHTRKRLEREGWESAPLIRVVELRKREPIGSKQSVQSAERDWSCRWLVRSHWRKQYYPSKGITNPIPIPWHLKGPVGKPLKPPRATVFAVIR